MSCPVVGEAAGQISLSLLRARYYSVPRLWCACTQGRCPPTLSTYQFSVPTPSAPSTLLHQACWCSSCSSPWPLQTLGQQELGKDIGTWFACILCTPLPVARPRSQDDCSCYVKRNSHMGQKAKKPKTCLWLSCHVCLGGKRAHLSMTQITWWTCGCST